jgi:fructose-bisphosphate aldolase, class II
MEKNMLSRAKLSPLLMKLAEAHLPFIRWESFMKMVVSEARAVDVPVVIHLDHATRLETIYKAFQLGFTSVMYDGSVLEFTQNISNSRHVTVIAHSLGVSVEAELGHIEGTTDEAAKPQNTGSHLTDPILAPVFVQETNIDALAISFGTAHGYYLKDPVLDFSILEEINCSIHTPLVLHGGTGLIDMDFLRSIQLGIRKINYGTDIFGTSAAIAWKTLCADPGLIMYHEVCQEIRKAFAIRRPIICGCGEAVVNPGSNNLISSHSGGKGWLRKQ